MIIRTISNSIMGIQRVIVGNYRTLLRFIDDFGFSKKKQRFLA